jgi:hypothetical protein
MRVVSSAFQRILGGVADQPLGVIHLFHHIVARRRCMPRIRCIDTAIRHGYRFPPDTPAHKWSNRCNVQATSPRDSRPACASPEALREPIVGNDQRIGVDHGALKPRIGTHVDAHLLTQPSSISIGGKAVEQIPRRSPMGRCQASVLFTQFEDRSEVADEGKSGP